MNGLAVLIPVALGLGLSGLGAFFWALRKGQFDDLDGAAVRILIDAGVPVNHVNNLGWTAMQEAIVLNDGGPRQQEVVRLLLDAGADPDIPDREGRTALENAERLGFAGIAALIRSRS